MEKLELLNPKHLLAKPTGQPIERRAADPVASKHDGVIMSFHKASVTEP